MCRERCSPQVSPLGHVPWAMRCPFHHLGRLFRSPGPGCGGIAVALTGQWLRPLFPDCSCAAGRAGLVTTSVSWPQARRTSVSESSGQVRADTPGAVRGQQFI